MIPVCVVGRDETDAGVSHGEREDEDVLALPEEGTAESEEGGDQHQVGGDDQQAQTPHHRLPPRGAVLQEATVRNIRIHRLT